MSAGVQVFLVHLAWQMVRQGGVLSPFLFAVYLDGLLEELSESDVGCYWGHLFAGAFCYADDVAPCASALRYL